MKIEIINPIDFPQWDQQVGELPGATIFHTSLWARVLSESYGYTPRYFCSFRQGRLQNVVPFMEIRSRVTGKRGVALPFSDRVDPLVEDRAVFDEIFSQVVDFGTRHGWRSLNFQGANEYINNGQPYQTYMSSQVTLGQTAHSIFMRLKGSARRNIKKAIKNGLTSEIVRDRQGIKDFYKLNCMLRRDHGLPPQPYPFFKQLRKHILSKGSGYISMVRHNGKPIAGVVFLLFGKNAIYKYGASDKRFKHLRPNNLSMWEAINWCAENRYLSVDMGRSDISQQGLLQYKRSWNSEEKKLHYYKYDLVRHRFVGRRHGVQPPHSIFRNLPLPILRGIGSVLYRHVG